MGGGGGAFAWSWWDRGGGARDGDLGGDGAARDRRGRERERAPEGRVRRPGAGRPSIEEREPGLREALLALLGGRDAWRSGVAASVDEPQRRQADRGVARAGVRGAREHGAPAAEGAGVQLAGQPQDARGSRSSRPRRTVQADRRALGAALAASEPLISVDTKKKELIGNYKNGGRELAPTGEPILVNTHDFIDEELGKAIPYGIYDVGRRRGLGRRSGSPPTPPSSRSRRSRRGGSTSARKRYPKAKTLTITADCGGSNSYRTRLWKTELQRLADDTGLRIRVMHYPPGTSKWNKIEHRLFSYISINWRAKPLVSRQTVIDLIASTTTTHRAEGLRPPRPQHLPHQAQSHRRANTRRQDRGR